MTYLLIDCGIPITVIEDNLKTKTKTESTNITTKTTTNDQDQQIHKACLYQQWTEVTLPYRQPSDWFPDLPLGYLAEKRKYPRYKEYSNKLQLAMRYWTTLRKAQMKGDTKTNAKTPS